MSTNLDSTLTRALDVAAQHLGIEKLFLQFGLDLNNITYDAVFARLTDIAMANINFANMLALIGSVFYVATLMMRTIVPLRVVGIVSIMFFIAYGVLAGAVATFLLYLLSLPINVIRLVQMLNLVKKARKSAEGDLSMDWLKPFMTPRKYRRNEVVFHKGDKANEMFLTVSGKFLVTELGVELPPGRIMGEIGFVTVSPKNRRTQTIKCIENGDVLTISYEKLLELCFQNPELGYYLLCLTSERLLHNIARLEAIVAAQSKSPASLVYSQTSDGST